jgi:hypothetical protein
MSIFLLSPRQAAIYAEKAEHKRIFSLVLFLFYLSFAMMSRAQKIVLSQNIEEGREKEPSQDETLDREGFLRFH